MSKINFLPILFAVLCLCSCSASILPPPEIPGGYTEKEAHLDNSPWMDFIDYRKYTYPDNSDSLFEKSRYYKKVDKEAMETLKHFYMDFKNWMEADERLDEYDFDFSCINDGDFYCINRPDDGGEWYRLFLYDKESRTLYDCYAKW